MPSRVHDVRSHRGVSEVGGVSSTGKLFCLACLHARTRARTHTAMYGRSGSVNLSGHLSSPFQFICIFCVFPALAGFGSAFFLGCLEDLRFFAKLECMGDQFVRVFSRKVYLCNT